MPIDFDKFKTLPGPAFNSLTRSHRKSQRSEISFAFSLQLSFFNKQHVDIFFSQCSQFNLGIVRLVQSPLLTSLS